MAFKTNNGAWLLGLLLTACTTAPVANHYQGTLHLKGSAPFPMVILEEKSGKQWLLDGIDKATSEKLQNRIVEIDATILPDAHVPLQKLKINKIKEISINP